MATKVDRTHIRDPFNVEAEYNCHDGEVTLTFSGGQYPNTKEYVIHMRVWFMQYIVYALKDAEKEAQKELDAFVQSVSSGVEL